MTRPVKPLRVQPLWARVDQNRVKLAAFVVFFVLGSSVLLTAALVALPASLIGAFGAYYEGWWGPAAYTEGTDGIAAPPLEESQSAAAQGEGGRPEGTYSVGWSPGRCSSWTAAPSGISRWEPTLEDRSRSASSWH